MYRKGKQFSKIWMLPCFAAVFVTGVFGQSDPPRPQSHPLPVDRSKRPPYTKKFPAIYIRERSTNEKSIAVDPNVEMKICVLEGKLKINGWARDEVRVFVKNGSSITLKVLEKNAAGKPVWLRVTGSTGPGDQPSPRTDCLSGENIELDVPMRASLNLEGRVTETTVDSVKKVAVKNIGGNIFLHNITGGITASTYEGDVTVENSGGQISLVSSTGNIVAFEVSPGQIGDIFRAKTSNGAISLQRVDHRQIEANSISGSVLFNGKFLSGGLYNFKTSNGSIRMTLPVESSFQIIASYGFGSFNSDIPLKTILENVTSGGKSLHGMIGAGDATLNLTTNSGSIGIKKQ
ncbi:MAG: DUF4097 family beta strand repeat protein [Blastocatellia bacterium]|nr:DUF4097 family beta strand repeat protein [Blastocatellia bacterium]MDQ3221125.1 DUF4097 domain-containing protein [Acidobacteriota bacterium]